MAKREKGDDVILGWICIHALKEGFSAKLVEELIRCVPEVKESRALEQRLALRYLEESVCIKKKVDASTGTLLGTVADLLPLPEEEFKELLLRVKTQAVLSVLRTKHFKLENYAAAIRSLLVPGGGDVDVSSTSKRKAELQKVLQVADWEAASKALLERHPVEPLLKELEGVVESVRQALKKQPLPYPTEAFPEEPVAPAATQGAPGQAQAASADVSKGAEQHAEVTNKETSGSKGAQTAENGPQMDVSKGAAVAASSGADVSTRTAEALPGTSRGTRQVEADVSKGREKVVGDVSKGVPADVSKGKETLPPKVGKGKETKSAEVTKGKGPLFVYVSKRKEAVAADMSNGKEVAVADISKGREAAPADVRKGKEPAEHQAGVSKKAAQGDVRAPADVSNSGVRRPGRPRKYPVSDAPKEKRPPGRPRKHPKPEEAPKSTEKRPPGRPRKEGQGKSPGSEKVNEPAAKSTVTNQAPKVQSEADVTGAKGPFRTAWHEEESSSDEEGLTLNRPISMLLSPKGPLLEKVGGLYVSPTSRLKRVILEIEDTQALQEPEPLDVPQSKGASAEPLDARKGTAEVPEQRLRDTEPLGASPAKRRIALEVPPAKKALGRPRKEDSAQKKPSWADWREGDEPTAGKRGPGRPRKEPKPATERLEDIPPRGSLVNSTSKQRGAEGPAAKKRKTTSDPLSPSKTKRGVDGTPKQGLDGTARMRNGATARVQADVAEEEEATVLVGVRLRDSEEDSDDVCKECAEGGQLLLCDMCPSAYHLSCAGLARLPEANWFCQDCLKTLAEKLKNAQKPAAPPKPAAQEDVPGGGRRRKATERKAPDDDHEPSRRGQPRSPPKTSPPKASLRDAWDDLERQTPPKRKPTGTQSKKGAEQRQAKAQGNRVLDFEMRDVEAQKQTLAKEQEEEVDMDDHDDLCAVCFQAGELICCEMCPRAEHFACAGFVEDADTPPPWYCKLCIHKRKLTSRR